MVGDGPWTDVGSPDGPGWDEDAPDTSDGPLVEDPAALERAEQAVRGENAGPTEAPDPDSRWIPIARGSGVPVVGGLNDVALALMSEGVEVGWDPFDPREAVAGIGPLTTPRLFRLLVEEDQLAEAHRLLEGANVEGVEFLSPERPRVDRTAPAGDAASGLRPSAGPSPMSDNALLESTAGRGPSRAGAVLLALTLVAAAVAVAPVLGRG